MRSLVLASLLVTLSLVGCHCSDECRSAAECASGVCRDGRCVPPSPTDDGGHEPVEGDAG